MEGQKAMSVIRSTEEVADKILMNKAELVQLDKRRQQTREAIRATEKLSAEEKKVWITIGSMLIKMERSKAVQLLKNDAATIELEISKLESEQRVLVNKHRDLEHFSPYSGTGLKPFSHKEFAAFKANFPLL